MWGVKRGPGLRRLIAPGVGAGMVAALAGVGMTSGVAQGVAPAHAYASRAGATARPTVQVADTADGWLLVTGTDYTVYAFIRPHGAKDNCIQSKRCRTEWPAVTTLGKPVAGSGVEKSLLGTIPYRGRRRQVTYHGYPLHRYEFDGGKESVMNIGNHQFGGAWYALNSRGGLVK